MCWFLRQFACDFSLRRVYESTQDAAIAPRCKDPRARNPDLTRFGRVPILQSPAEYGQVAQLVERGPEKAGVGGSIPSLATIKSRQKLKGKRQKDWGAFSSVSGILSFAIRESRKQ